MAINTHGDPADEATDYNQQSGSYDLDDSGETIYATKNIGAERVDGATIDELTGDSGMLRPPEERLEPEE